MAHLQAQEKKHPATVISRYTLGQAEKKHDRELVKFPYNSKFVILQIISFCRLT
jgi:hypothetical protein